MNLGFLGVGYSNCSIQEIEAVYLSADRVLELYRQPFQYIESICLLETCNRVEFYFEYTHSFEHACTELILFVSRANSILEADVRSIFQLKSGGNARDHLFQVVCGLQSMVFGENEILGQVKKAYQFAMDHGAMTALINKVFQTAISIGKRARSETEISKGAYSVSSIALECIRDAQVDYLNQKILIVGAGTMGRRLVAKLAKMGHTDVTIANRSPEKALQLAQEYHFSTFDYSDFLTHSHLFDILILATSSADYLLNQSHFSDQFCPYDFVIDLGLPRNVDPAVSAFSKVKLVALDGFQSVVKKTFTDRSSEVDKVRMIITEDAIKFDHWFEHRLS